MKKRIWGVCLFLLISVLLGAQEIKNPFLAGEWLFVDFPTGCAHLTMEFLPGESVKIFAKVDPYSGKKRTDTYTVYKYSIMTNGYHDDIPLLNIDDFGTFFFSTINADKIIITSLDKANNHAHTQVCALIRAEEIKEYGFGK